MRQAQESVGEDARPGGCAPTRNPEYGNTVSRGQSLTPLDVESK
jgi:hypothetical protein